MNINKVFLMGRLTADPELKYSANNVPNLRFTIAVNRRFQSKSGEGENQQTTDFIDCIAFRQQAEFVSKYFKKGSLIIAFGSLHIEQWKDKNGNNQRTARVYVDEVQFGESKQSGASSRSFASEAPAETKREPEAFSNTSDNNEFFSDVKGIDDEELPF